MFPGFKDWEYRTSQKTLMLLEKPLALQREHPVLQNFFWGGGVAFLGPDLNRIRIQSGSGSETQFGVP